MKLGSHKRTNVWSHFSEGPGIVRFRDRSGVVLARGRGRESGEFRSVGTELKFGKMTKF